MIRIAGIGLIAACVLAGTTLDAGDKKSKGTLIGELKSKKKTPNGKNYRIEVLAAGEEKARSYFVGYDPKVKGPIATVLEAVGKANIGDRVQVDWVNTGEGYAITSFQVLKKADKKEDKKERG